MKTLKQTIEEALNTIDVKNKDQITDKIIRSIECNESLRITQIYPNEIHSAKPDPLRGLTY